MQWRAGPVAADEHQKGRNLEVVSLEKSLGVAEGGLAAYLGNGFEDGRAGRLGLESREAQPLLGGKRSFVGDCSPKIRITLGRSKIRTADFCRW